MKRALAIEIISFSFIALFMYAAVSKFTDIEKFRIQIGQSPLLTEYSSLISWLVPSTEIILCFILSIPRLRLIGLYCSLSMMVSFTVYIVFITRFADYVPCSCGGVLEKMDWGEHLMLNISFVALAVIAIVLQESKEFNRLGISTIGWRLISLVGCGVFGIVLVSTLYFYSNKSNHLNNSFVRLFPPNLVTQVGMMDIKYNSYYIAGATGNYIYLGNVTAPLNIVIANTMLTDSQHVRVGTSGIAREKLGSVHITVDSPYFYLTNGSVMPGLLRGKINTWRAERFTFDSVYFNASSVISPSSLALRVVSTTTNEYTLSKLSEMAPHLTFRPELLQKQIDGKFCVDGMLNHDKELNLIVYLYYYRNQYLVMDTSLNLIYRGKTIDTTSHAKIKVGYVHSDNSATMAAPPLTVNKSSAVSNGQLFINSGLMAKNESKKKFEQTSVIDVYDLQKRMYEFSFYLYDRNEKKLRDFFVLNNRLFALYDHYIVAFDLDLRIDHREQLTNYVGTNSIEMSEKKLPAGNDQSLLND